MPEAGYLETMTKRIPKPICGASLSCLVPFLLVLPAIACVEFEAPPKYVGTSFSVRVTKYSVPASGVRVELGPHVSVNSVPLRSPEPVPDTPAATTDADGVAQFVNVPVGQYDVVAALGRSNDRPVMFIEVRGSSTPKPDDVFLNWPSTRFLRTQSLEGVIHLPSGREELPLQLVEPETGRVIETSKLTDGTFKFAETEPGHYYVRFLGRLFKNDRTESLGDMGLWLDPSPGVSPVVNADVMFSDCGIMFGESCSHPKIAVPRACGRVVDSSGAAFPNAEIKLFGHELTLITQLKTNSMGQFDFGSIPRGDYDIKVDQPGFPSLTQQVDVSETDNKQCSAPLTLVISFPGGDCKSTVGVH